MQAFHLEPGDGASKPRTGQFARIGPLKRPTVEAPLGWVLSHTAQCGLDEQLKTYEPPAAVLDQDLIKPSDGCPDAEQQPLQSKLDE
jgi:hypothetical protein